jgi:hypothetical protein
MTALSEYRKNEEINYRPVSVLAFLALIVSLISALTVANVILAFLPITAILIAVFALLRIRASDRNYIGANVARAAMFIACFFLAMSVVYNGWQSYHRWSTARAYAEDWLAMMQQGELEEVHQLTLELENRQIPGADLKDYYAVGNRAPKPQMVGKRQPQTEYQSYWEILYPQKLIVAEGNEGRFEFVRNKKYEKLPKGEIYQLIFRYFPADKKLTSIVMGENKADIPVNPLEFEIYMKRLVEPPPVGAQWQVFIVRIEGVLQKNVGRTTE